MTTPAELEIINHLGGKNPDAEYILKNFGIIENYSKKREISTEPTSALDKLVKQRLRSPTRKWRKMVRSPVTKDTRTCKGCGKLLPFECRTCPECALETDQQWIEMPTVNEMRFKLQTHQIPCAYKRINHFNEKLAQFQGKEKTVIPSDVFNNIKCEINKNTSLNIDEVTPRDIKYILKKLGYSKYYEHVNYITYTINGHSLPSLATHEEERLRSMFNQIQRPFSSHSPVWRKNFLNYAYIFRKFLELLEWDWLLVHFSELKSREKLYEQDKIWKLICTDLGWEFIPSL